MDVEARVFAPFGKLVESKLQPAIQARASFQAAFNSDKRALLAQQEKAATEWKREQDKIAAERAAAEAKAQIAAAEAARVAAAESARVAAEAAAAQAAQLAAQQAAAAEAARQAAAQLAAAQAAQARAEEEARRRSESYFSLNRGFVLNGKRIW